MYNYNILFVDVRAVWLQNKQLLLLLLSENYVNRKAHVKLKPIRFTLSTLNVYNAMLHICI